MRSKGPPLRFLIFACGNQDETREALYTKLRNQFMAKAGSARGTPGGLWNRSPQVLCSDVSIFPVPMNFRFGSFNQLLHGADELERHDVVCERALRGIERHARSVDTEAQLGVHWQRSSISVEQYMHRFTWEDSKYPKWKSIGDTVEAIMKMVTRLERDVNTRTVSFREAQRAAAAPHESALSFTHTDLATVLVPSVVDEGDFMHTEHLTTRVVVVPRGQESQLLAEYERYHEMVVPRSAKKFPVADRHENTLFRVVLFKQAVGGFTEKASAQRFTIRNFIYDAQLFYENEAAMSMKEKEATRQASNLAKVCETAYSEVLIAWIHLKALRVFAEGILRFGLPPNFTAILLRPTSESGETHLKRELAAIFGYKSNGGETQSLKGSFEKEAAGDPNGDEYLPFFCLTLQPFGDSSVAH